MPATTAPASSSARRRTFETIPASICRYQHRDPAAVGCHVSPRTMRCAPQACRLSVLPPRSCSASVRLPGGRIRPCLRRAGPAAGTGIYGSTFFMSPGSRFPRELGAVMLFCIWLRTMKGHSLRNGLRLRAVAWSGTRRRRLVRPVHLRLLDLTFGTDHCIRFGGALRRPASFLAHSMINEPGGTREDGEYIQRDPRLVVELKILGAERQAWSLRRSLRHPRLSPRSADQASKRTLVRERRSAGTTCEGVNIKIMIEGASGRCLRACSSSMSTPSVCT